MKRMLYVLLAFGSLLAGVASAQVATGSMDVQWDAGAADCNANHPRPLQVHRYNERTYILRESLCATYEGPFMYLLIGDSKALLIDSGDVSEAQKMPLASTVMSLLPTVGGARLPLIVVHTHGHLDHRSGDVQFASLPQVTIVGTDLAHVTEYFGFSHWPDGIAQVDLGNRIVDVVPTPGHYASHVSYYDRATGLVFTGDFLLPGRLIIDDADADRASAARMADFMRTRPVTYVLGGHIELDRNGQTLEMGSSYHPNERALPLGKDALMNLPTVLASYNGFYGQNGMFVMYSQTRMLQCLGVIAVVLLIGMAFGIRWFVRRRRHRYATPEVAT
ncbi:MBL fold metallo-hydrolase [Dyella halodurans]|uniref:MBL fold metallo-hydrolase n=1 Tax=Dyella halodurans TaxID=1920171 RepID=A0ABV9C2P0_9GAMM|nr:MBL fold metallo-hydrolase [Dyella halodurans]